jgi:hypothetical protein
MVAAPEDLAVGAPAQGAEDLVPVREVVVLDDEIVAAVVVVAMIFRGIGYSRGLLLAAGADEVDVFIVEDLLPLVVREVCDLALQDVYRVHGRQLDQTKAYGRPDIPSGAEEGTEGCGWGILSMSSSSSCVAPFASLFAC